MSLRRLEDISCRRIEDISWRHLEDVLKTENVYWGYLFLTNLNVYLTYLYFTNLYSDESKSSHSKAFIYLKSLKAICEEVNL